MATHGFTSSRGAPAQAKEEQRDMEKRFVDILTRQFPFLSRAEIEQEVRLAELLSGAGPLAWRRTKFKLIDIARKEMLFRSRFLSLFDCDGIENIATEDRALRMLDEADEWREIRRNLPIRARKLAEIAEHHAQRFEDVPGGMWTYANLRELRRRIRRDYIAWDWRHSYRAFYETRAILVRALERNRLNRRL